MLEDIVEIYVGLIKFTTALYDTLTIVTACNTEIGIKKEINIDKPVKIKKKCNTTKYISINRSK